MFTDKMEHIYRYSVKKKKRKTTITGDFMVNVKNLVTKAVSAAASQQGWMDESIIFQYIMVIE